MIAVGTPSDTDGSSINTDKDIVYLNGGPNKYGLEHFDTNDLWGNHDRWKGKFLLSSLRPN